MLYDFSLAWESWDLLLWHNKLQSNNCNIFSPSPLCKFICFDSDAIAMQDIACLVLWSVLGTEGGNAIIFTAFFHLSLNRHPSRSDAMSRHGFCQMFHTSKVKKMRMEDILLIYFDQIFSFLCNHLLKYVQSHSIYFLKTPAWIRQFSQKGQCLPLILDNFTWAQKCFRQEPLVTNSMSRPNGMHWSSSSSSRYSLFQKSCLLLSIISSKQSKLNK